MIRGEIASACLSDPEGNEFSIRADFAGGEPKGGGVADTTSGAHAIVRLPFRKFRFRRRCLRRDDAGQVAGQTREDFAGQVSADRLPRLPGDFLIPEQR